MRIGRPRSTSSFAATQSSATSRVLFVVRALIEQAKGILMERHETDQEEAFALLRDRARKTNRKLVDVATAVVEGRCLLPKATQHATIPDD